MSGQLDFADATLLNTSSISGAIVKQSQALNLAALQAGGAVASASFNVGAALPANARLLSAEIVVGTALAKTGLTTAVATLQATAETAAAILASSSVATTGTLGALGINPYPSRGGQQIQITVTVAGVGVLLSGLTAGSLTVNLFYAVL